MSSPAPGPSRRRFRPALVVYAALAVALLAVTVTGDVAVTAGQRSTVNRSSGDEGENADPQAGAHESHGSDQPEAKNGSGSGKNSQKSPGNSDPDQALSRSIDRLISSSGSEVRLSVSVLDLADGTNASYGEETFDTASIVKVDILATLLLQAQDEGRELTSSERATAEVMIESSDNSAANDLWQAIGGASGLDAANERLGLRHTSGGQDGLWGLTQTTSEDQIALLEAVYGEDSVLEPASQAYIQELMGSVVSGQRWGVSAAADGDYELKNGWLARSQTGYWDINSIGRVAAGGRSYLIAVVSDGHATQSGGIAVVEDAAEAAVSAVSPDAG